MGREIRRVPKGWEHPRDQRGNFQPMFDEDYETAAQVWVAEFLAWQNGTHPDRANHPGSCYYYWQWAGDPPDIDYYHAKWTAEEATCYQVYETCSEGTPVSPVFETREELEVWIRDPQNGFSGWAIDWLLEKGSVCSMIIDHGVASLAQKIQ